MEDKSPPRAPTTFATVSAFLTALFVLLVMVGLFYFRSLFAPAPFVPDPAPAPAPAPAPPCCEPARMPLSSLRDFRVSDMQVGEERWISCGAIHVRHNRDTYVDTQASAFSQRKGNRLFDAFQGAVADCPLRLRKEANGFTLKMPGPPTRIEWVREWEPSPSRDKWRVPVTLIIQQKGDLE